MRGLLLGVLGAALLSGCVVDRTGRSATYLLEDKVDGNRQRVVRMQKDLALQVSRVDDMEQRAANARQRLADSGAARPRPNLPLPLCGSWESTKIHIFHILTKTC